MERFFLAAGSIAALIAVGAGAFGRTGCGSGWDLGCWRSSRRVRATRMYHSLALLAVAWACTRLRGGLPPAAGWLFIVGIVIFSGSLYALALTGQRWLGAVAPVGGAAFLAGWTLLAIAAVRG